MVVSAWWNQSQVARLFQENMQADAVPLLKDYDTYTASLPVRERGISKPLKLYQLVFYVRDSDLDAFAARIAADEQRPTVAYIAAASHSGKSASVLVGFLRARAKHCGRAARSEFHPLPVRALCEQRRELPYQGKRCQAEESMFR